MQEDNRSAVDFLDLLVGMSEGGVKAVNFQPDENETLGFFNKHEPDGDINLVEYEVTRHRTGIMDIKMRKEH